MGEPDIKKYLLGLTVTIERRRKKGPISILLYPYVVESPTPKSSPENYLQYPEYLPTWSPYQKYPPLEPFEHYDHGVDADASFPDLLPASAQKEDLTPSIGSSIRGIQLSSLNSAGKDQLALLTAQRKVVVFRDQDFADLPIKDALAYGGYFGRHHIMPISGTPKDFPEIRK